MGGVASPTRPAGPKQLHVCADTVSMICTTNSTMITRGQEKERTLYFPLTFSSISISWIFEWGVAVPVCRLPYQCATALSSILQVQVVSHSAILTHLGAQEAFYEQEGAFQKVPIASSVSFTSPQGCALAVWQSLHIHFSSYSTGDLNQL